jgi:tetratricopeptide (TPR) repeat protein
VTVGGGATLIASGLAQKYASVVFSSTNSGTLKSLVEIAKPKPVRAPPKIKRAKPKMVLIATDDSMVASTEAQLMNQIQDGFTKPNNTEEIVRLARGYTAIGLVEKANKTLTDCRAKNPKNAIAALFDALYACQAGDPSAAHAILAPFLQESTLSAKIVAASAIAQHASGETVQAKETLAKLEEADRQNPIARLAGALLASDQLTGPELLSLTTEFPDMNGYLSTLLQAGSATSIQEKSRLMANSEKASAQLRGIAVRLLWQHGQHDEAASISAKIVSQQPSSLGAQWVIGSVLLSGGAASRAAEHARRAEAFASHPDQAIDLIRLRAQALQTSGQHDAAIDAWQSVLKLGPDPQASAAIRQLNQLRNGQP